MDLTEQSMIVDNQGVTTTPQKIKITKKLPPTQAGTTVIYDEFKKPHELEIAAYPELTVIVKKGNDWYFDKETSELSEEMLKITQNIEDFYYYTKKFLPYSVYLLAVHKYPHNTLERFKANPFFLLDLDVDYNFRELDAAITVSSFEHRLNEVKYAMLCVLKNNETSGHTLMNEDDFCNRIYRLLKSTGHEISINEIFAYLNYYSELFYHKEGVVALMDAYKKEQHILYIANQMREKRNYAGFSHRHNNQLSDEQNECVGQLISGSNLSILTGGPGTGKTTTLLDLVSSFNDAYPDARIVLLAPTGKAGRRIKEVFRKLDVNIYTIHYFLGLGRFRNKQDIKRIQSADFIIIDESSMIGVDLFYNLLVNVDTDRVKILLVGDVDQLPSVEAGNLLMDLIGLGIDTAYLTQNFRSNSSINQNAQDINAGIPILIEDECFCIRELDNDFLSPFFVGLETDVLLTPFRKEQDASGREIVGSCNGINSEIHKRRHPKTKGYAPHEPIIINHTNYGVGYINGETGYVARVSPDGLYVSIDGKERLISNSDDVSLGYAITVHKSQGSEYDKVTICLPSGVSNFFTRQMLYTAVTRAAKSVEIIGSKKEIAKIIANNTKQKRNTFLNLWQKARE